MTGAVSVHAVIDGPTDAPTLVLSNSLGSTLAMWDAQVPALSQHLRIVRYDLRGHGASPVPPAPYDIADLGADLLGLLDRLGVARAHIGGLSIGGMVGMWVAAHAPERVDRLVLCCTLPRFDPPETWAERAAIVRSEGAASVADVVVGRWFTPAFAAEHADVVHEMRAMIASTPAEGYAACCGVLERTDLRPHLAGIAAPTLVIAGSEDPAVPASEAERICEAIPDCHFAIVDHAAHLANIERADRVTELMLAHLLDEPDGASIKEDP